VRPKKQPCSQDLRNPEPGAYHHRKEGRLFHGKLGGNWSNAHLRNENRRV